MGKNVFDQYTLLHFAVGVIAYFFGFGIITTLVLHIIFEIVENSEPGMRFINTYLANVWPGGKPYADSFGNSMIGDNIGTMLGWTLAYILDHVGTRRGWYVPHLAATEHLVEK